VGNLIGTWYNKRKSIPMLIIWRTIYVFYFSNKILLVFYESTNEEVKKEIFGVFW
jgi:hypothetical protein